MNIHNFELNKLKTDSNLVTGVDEYICVMSDTYKFFILYNVCKISHNSLITTHLYKTQLYLC